MHFCLKKCIKHVKIALFYPKIGVKLAFLAIFSIKININGTPLTRPNIG